MSWERKVLGDISTSIQTGPFGSQLHQSDYSDEGVPVVMPKDLIQGAVSDYFYLLANSASSFLSITKSRNDWVGNKSCCRFYNVKFKHFNPKRRASRCPRNRDSEEDSKDTFIL